MARRATPPAETVEPVLAPLRAARQQQDAANTAFAAALRAAAQHDPRPTYRQIGEAIGMTADGVRTLLNGRRP